MPDPDTDSERVPQQPAAPRFQVHAHCVVGHEVIVAMNPSMARMVSNLIYESDLDEDENALKAFGKALKHAKSEYHNYPRTKPQYD